MGWALSVGSSLLQLWSLRNNLQCAAGALAEAQTAGASAEEFNISNLTNDNGFPLGYCDGTKIVEKRFNITAGTFTAIP